MLKNNLPRIIVVLGPTATQKTKLSIKLAKEFNGELINADAFQVYRELNIGVNKPTNAEVTEAQFHLLSCVSIYDKWNIKRFQDAANEIINQIIARKHIPIIVGGSHLYIDTLIYNYDLSDMPERSDEFTDWDNQKLFDELSRRDSILANNIGINNQKRLIRALQIVTKDKKLTDKKEPIYDALLVCCTNEREQLYELINRRVDAMFKSGWVTEVKELLAKDKNIIKLNALKAIGYDEIIDALVNNHNIDIEKIKQRSRHYAKKQLTWINHHYVDPLYFDQHNEDKVIAAIKTWLK